MGLPALLSLSHYIFALLFPLAQLAILFVMKRPAGERVRVAIVGAVSLRGVEFAHTNDVS